MGSFILSLLISVTGSGDAPSARVSVVFVEPVEDLNEPAGDFRPTGDVMPSVDAWPADGLSPGNLTFGVPLEGDSWPVPSVDEWTVHDVAAWASHHSPIANLFDSERRALSSGLDHDDEVRSAQVGLSQAILRSLAKHDRQQNGADAAKIPHRISGLQRQLRLLNQAKTVVADLALLAVKAEELELSNNDPNQLYQQRLTLDDQVTQAEFGIRKLRRDLVRRIGQPRHLADLALVRDQLITWSVPNAVDWLPVSPDDVDAAIEVAYAHRADLESIATLCRCMTVDSLPAARSMMAMIQPGLGLAASGDSKLDPFHGLALLHGMGEKELRQHELACRRAQCRELQQSARDTIADQVSMAALEILEARQRLSIALSAELVSQAHFTRQRSAVEIEKADPGSDRTAELEWLQYRGATVDRQVDLALARTEWIKVIGLQVTSVQPSLLLPIQQ